MATNGRHTLVTGTTTRKAKQYVENYVLCAATVDPLHTALLTVTCLRCPPGASCSKAALEQKIHASCTTAAALAHTTSLMKIAPRAAKTNPTGAMRHRAVWCAVLMNAKLPWTVTSSLPCGQLDLSIRHQTVEGLHRQFARLCKRKERSGQRGVGHIQLIKLGNGLLKNV